MIVSNKTRVSLVPCSIVVRLLSDCLGLFLLWVWRGPARTRTGWPAALRDDCSVGWRGDPNNSADRGVGLLAGGSRFEEPASTGGDDNCPVN